MNNLTRKATVGVVAVAAVLAFRASTAVADYQVSVIRNDTYQSVQAFYRWGDGPWTRFSLLPGKTYATWLDLRLGPVPLFISFDADPGPGIYPVGYRLRTYRHPTTWFNFGPTEVFRIRLDGRRDLYRTRP